ncbi:hypothetical protein K8R78_01315 [bacterium]|nr:hypothetical protein [bacterium]
MKAATLLLLIAILLTPGWAESYSGFALNAEVGLNTFGVTSIPVNFAGGVDIGYRLEEVAFTLGYSIEPFAELGGVQGPRLLVYHYTSPARQLSIRLGGGVNYFWRLAPFRLGGKEEAPRVESMWTGQLNIMLGAKLVGPLNAALDAAIFMPLEEKVGLTVRLFFGLVFQL